MGSVPGLERSLGEGNENPFLYSCLGNPMDRGAWWVIVHGVTKVRHDLATNQQTTIFFKLDSNDGFTVLWICPKPLIFAL